MLDKNPLVGRTKHLKLVLPGLVTSTGANLTAGGVVEDFELCLPNCTSMSYSVLTAFSKPTNSMLLYAPKLQSADSIMKHWMPKVVIGFFDNAGSLAQFIHGDGNVGVEYCHVYAPKCTNFGGAFGRDITTLKELYITGAGADNVSFSDMCTGDTGLVKFSADNVHKVTNAAACFERCSSLPDAQIPRAWPALSIGWSMFKKCSLLTEETANAILDSLPAYETGQHIISFDGTLAEQAWNTDGADLSHVEAANEKGWSVVWESEVYDRAFIDFNSQQGGSYRLFSRWSFCREFHADLPDLADGTSLFEGIASLEVFSGALSSLSAGTNMFRNCNLDAASVLHILESIPSYTSGSHPLHIGKKEKWVDNADVATALGTTAPITAGNYTVKGWTITVQ